MRGRRAQVAFNFSPEIGWRTRFGRPIVRWGDLSRSSISKRSKGSGAVAGLSAARGEHHSTTIADLPARIELEHASAERRVCVERNADAYRTGFTLQRAGLEAKRDNAVEVRRDKQEFLASIPLASPESDSDSHLRLGSGSGFAYYFILILLAAVEWPTVWASLEYAPFEDALKYILTTGLATAISMSAHVISEYGWEVIAARNDLDGAGTAQSNGVPGSPEGKRSATSRRLEIRLKTLLASGLFVAMLSLMVFMFLSRGESFARIAEVTKGGVFSDSDLLSGTLLALQVVLFLVALGMGIVRAKDKEARQKASDERKRRRAALRRSRKLERRRWRAERALRSAIKREHRYETEIEAIDTRLAAVDEARQRWLDQEDAYLSRMLADHDAEYEDAEHSSVVMYREENSSDSAHRGSGDGRTFWQRIWPVLGWVMFGATVLTLILTGGN